MGLHFGIWTAFRADAYMNMLGIDGGSVAIAIAIAIAMATSSGSSGSTNMEGGG